MAELTADSVRAEVRAWLQEHWDPARGLVDFTIPRFDAFIRRRDEPDLGPDELGYPAAVVPWLEDAP